MIETGVDIIGKYFSGITPEQSALYSRLYPLYADWNQKINVISRKDIGHLYERHVLHSLSIAKFVRFLPGTRILDAGTGGGFPGIPLAILFPDVQFHLIDSIGKKIKVVNEIAGALGLENVSAEQIRAEQAEGKYDFVISRAVTQLPEFVSWIRRNISNKQKNAVPNGVIYLKGGNFEKEIGSFGRNAYVQELSEYFDEAFFLTKKLVHISSV